MTIRQHLISLLLDDNEFWDQRIDIFTKIQQHNEYTCTRLKLPKTFLTVTLHTEPKRLSIRR